MYPEYRKGFVLTLLGVLIFTPDTLLIRLTSLEFFSLTVGRGTIGGLAILLGLALYYRREFKKQILAIGGWGLVLAVLQGSGTWTFHAALKNTSVANVLVFLASVPLISALMTKMFLQDEIQKPTWIAIGVVGFGLLIVGGPGLAGGNWLGDFLALLNAVVIAGFFTVVRGRRTVNLIPASGFGLLLAALAAYPFAVFPEISSFQWLYLILSAGVVLPVGLGLLTLGPRYLPAPDAAMLILLETVFGPLWVWLVISEQPDANTFVGGAIVVGSLFLHGLWRVRRASQA
jgi:drug/metabolite transporter (DMT)-like permease